MTLIAFVPSAGGDARDRLRGPVNLRCPNCTRLTAHEGTHAPWCGWCLQSLCSAACARRHGRDGFRAARAALERLLRGVG
jgi:hypothetical protein